MKIHIFIENWQQNGTRVDIFSLLENFKQVHLILFAFNLIHLRVLFKNVWKGIYYIHFVKFNIIY